MRFEKTEDGIIDTQTGLIWKSEDEPGMYTFDEALAHTKNVTDWRLPTVEELSSILDRTVLSPACNPIFNMKPSVYWSSSPYANFSDAAWFVNFYNGNVGNSYRSNDWWVRLVRTIGGK